MEGDEAPPPLAHTQLPHIKQDISVCDPQQQPILTFWPYIIEHAISSIGSGAAVHIACHYHRWRLRRIREISRRSLAHPLTHSRTPLPR